MKTIDDLPAEVLANILSFATPYIDIFIKLRLMNSKWNEAVKYRLSRVKHLIQTSVYDDDYISSIPAETMFSIAPTGSYFDHSGWDDKYTRYFISLMEMLPGLQAVEMQNIYRLRKTADGYYSYQCDPLHDLSIQNKIFSYFNSRPTIKALAICIDWSWKDGDIEAELEKAVKLQNITMLSIECVSYLKGKICEQFIEYFFPTDHEFEQLWLNYVNDLSFIFQKKTKIRKLYHQIARNWYTDNELDLIMTNHLCDLEIFGVMSITKDILEYLSKVTSLSPKLTSIHVHLCYNKQLEPMKNFKQFNQVENLVIESMHLRISSSYAEKIIRMYPMVKHLSIKNLSVLSQEEILSIFQWMPNLSILHLVYYRDSNKAPRTVNVDNLMSAYNQLHGRLIKIRVTEKVINYNKYNYTRITFKRGFDFMKHIFYSDDYNQPHILIE